MYSRIVNPKTGHEVFVNSSLGQKIINKYSNQIAQIAGGKGKKKKKLKIKPKCAICKQPGHNKSGCPHNIPWNCEACTFENTGNKLKCDVCETKRPAFKNPPKSGDNKSKKSADESGPTYNQPTPLIGYAGNLPYIEAQVSHNCAKHAINHILQEDKVELGCLCSLWTPDHLIPVANRGGNPVTNPHKKLRLHYCALLVARQEEAQLGTNQHVDWNFLGKSGFADRKDGNWGVITIQYALSDVFNCRTDIYMNHGGKIWTKDKQALNADIANQDLIGFILNIKYFTFSGKGKNKTKQEHRHFISLHNKWTGCYPGGGAAPQFTYLESILADDTRQPQWGCGSFKDIMDWANSEYEIVAMIPIFKKRDVDNNVVSYVCSGCN